MKKPKNINKVKTGLHRLDVMTGGIPEGQFLEIYGYEYSGKTTLALEISKAFKRVLYVDFEHKSDPVYHDAIGCSMEIVEGEVFEATMDTVLQKIQKKGKRKYDLIIIDSLGASICKWEYEADLMDNTIGRKAQAVTRFLRKAELIFPNLGITCIMINHRKDKIGPAFGASDYTPGGQQIKFSSIIRLALHRKRQDIFQAQDGCFCCIRQTKNQAAQDIPFSKCEYLILRGMGIIRGYEAYDVGWEKELITRQGQWYYLGDKKFHGKAEMIKFLDEHERLRRAIYGK